MGMWCTFVIVDKDGVHFETALMMKWTVYVQSLEFLACTVRSLAGTSMLYYTNTSTSIRSIVDVYNVW